MPPACLPISATATALRFFKSKTSTAPGSLPTPSTDTNAYLLSGEIETPCVTLRVFLNFAISLPFLRSHTPVLAALL